MNALLEALGYASLPGCASIPDALYRDLVRKWLMAQRQSEEIVEHLCL